MANKEQKSWQIRSRDHGTGRTAEHIGEEESLSFLIKI